MQNFFKKIVSSCQDALRRIMAWVVFIVTVAFSKMRGAWAFVLRVAQRSWQGIMYASSGIVPSIANFSRTVWSSVAQWCGVAMAFVVRAAQRSWQGIVYASSSIVRGVTEFGRMAWSKIVSRYRTTHYWLSGFRHTAGSSMYQGLGAVRGAYLRIRPRAWILYVVLIAILATITIGLLLYNDVINWPVQSSAESADRPEVSQVESHDEAAQVAAPSVPATPNVERRLLHVEEFLKKQEKRDDIKKAVKQTAVLEKKVDRLTHTLDTKTKAIATLEKKINERTDHQKKMVSQHKRLDDTLKATNNKVDDVKDVVKAQTKQIDALEGRAETASASEKQLLQEQQALEHRLTTTEQKVVELGKTLTQKLEALEKNLDAINQSNEQEERRLKEMDIKVREEVNKQFQTMREDAKAMQQKQDRKKLLKEALKSLVED